jgi:hypothetical protein
MEIDTEAGWFDDHEEGVRGGVLALVMHSSAPTKRGRLPGWKRRG